MNIRREIQPLLDCAAAAAAGCLWLTRRKDDDVDVDALAAPDVSSGSSAIQPAEDVAPVDRLVILVRRRGVLLRLLLLLFRVDIRQVHPRRQPFAPFLPPTEKRRAQDGQTGIDHAGMVILNMSPHILATST